MGNTGRKPSVSEALANPDIKVGDMTRSSGNGPGGQRLYQAWRWNGEDWIKVSETAYNRWLADTTRAEFLDGTEINSTIIEVGPLGGKLPTNAPNCYRWPLDSLDTGTDYIFFQFGKYIPPFSQDAQALRESSEAVLGENFEYGSADLRDELGYGSTTAAVQTMYNASASQLDVTDQPSIMLPMPQDLSTESNQQWQGKQFTATGRAAVAALAAGNFSYASSVVENIAGNATALQNAFNTTVLNSIPGVGGNLEFNDVSGSTRGVVINPNAELLYDSPEMREVGMIFRLVPRSYDESLEINYIIKAFRKASMPSWGSEDQDLLTGENTTQGGNIEKPSGFNLGDMNNWIHVPKLCKFTFMTGSKANKHVIQYKPCAISGVEVNYTPDGTWSSHTNPNNDNVMPGSAPTAIELRINFMETKLIFADEVDRGF